MTEPPPLRASRQPARRTKVDWLAGEQALAPGEPGCDRQRAQGEATGADSTQVTVNQALAADQRKPDFGYPYDSNDKQRDRSDAGNNVLRVVRGGSWDFPRGFGRCAYRLRISPVDRFDSLGFRVALRCAPVS